MSFFSAANNLLVPRSSRKFQGASKAPWTSTSGAKYSLHLCWQILQNMQSASSPLLSYIGSVKSAYFKPAISSR